jgi:hypothetical protein
MPIFMVTILAAKGDGSIRLIIPASVPVVFHLSAIGVKVVFSVNGSEGLWPQLVCCAPFPSIALVLQKH